MLQHLSDVQLLTRLIGARATKRLFAGKLAPLFLGDDRDAAIRILMVARELVCRLLAEDLTYRPAMANPDAVRRYLASLLYGRDHEAFVILFLDTQHQLLASEEVARGTLDSAAVYPREVVKAALRHNAAAVILSHNHPSGIAEPSAADRALTERLRQALAVIDIRVLDHFVVASGGTVSFAERGWL